MLYKKIRKEKITMEITKEFIFENIKQAVEAKDYSLEADECSLLYKIIAKNFEQMSYWKYEDYSFFGQLVAEEDVIKALYQIDLITQDDLGLPSSTTIAINVDDFTEDDLEEVIREYLSENYDYCVDDFEYKVSRSRESVLIFNIEWDFI